MGSPELSQLTQIIDKMDAGKLCEISKKTFASLDCVEKLLTQVFETDKLALHSISKEKDNMGIHGTAQTLSFSGCEFSNVSVCLLFTEKDDLIRLSVEADLGSGAALFSWLCDRIGFQINNVTCKASIAEDNLYPTCDVYATLQIGTVRFPVRVGVPLIREESVLALEPVAHSDFHFGIEEIISLLHAGDIAKQIPQNVWAIAQSVSLCGLTLYFHLKTRSVSRFEVAVQLLQGGTWEIFPGFRICNIKSTFLVDYDEQSKTDIVFGGTFILGDLAVPIQVYRYSASSRLVLQVCKSTGIQLSNVSSLSDLIGIPLTLPDIVGSSKLNLGHMRLDFDCDAASVASFDILLSIDSVLSIGAFQIESVGLIYSYQSQKGKSETNCIIKGFFSISDLTFDIQLSKLKQNGYLFSGYAQGCQGIEISKLFGDLGSALKLPKLPLPRFFLINIGVSYNSDAQSLTFKASAEMGSNSGSADFGFLNFKSANANVNLTCVKKNTKWSFQGTASGTIEILSSKFQFSYELNEKTNIIKLDWMPESPFSILDFCRFCGFEDIAIPDAINPALQSVSIQYDFHKGLFILNAVTQKYGTLYVCSMLVEQKRQYVFSLQLGMKLKLSSLPLVGDSVPGLDQVAIEGLVAMTATTDIEDLSKYGYEDSAAAVKGLTLSSTLTLSNKKIPIRIPLTSQTAKEQLCLSEEAAEHTEEGSITWVSLNQSVGPFVLRKIGGAYQDGSLWFALDAAFESGGLTFELDGLSVGYHINNKTMDFRLDGMALEVKTDSFSMSGGFLRRDQNTYAGELLLQMASFTLCAAGAYTTKPVQSIFAFAYLKANLGGPPCFFITGIAAGFGYNREFVVPDIEKLGDYPLLAVVQGNQQPSVLLKEDKKHFPTKHGSHWVAAGILFNSFKMIDSAALLSISFGNNTEINLLGRSVLTIPYQSKNPIASAVLLLKASVKPSSGLVAVEASIVEELSYILSKDCHLTGGFAFYMWYSGRYAGDFVISLGGYRNGYPKPAHYPAVKRLGFFWNISSKLTAKGGLYFALTPSCLMAGGNLEIVYESSRVRAWFTAYIDIYMQWKPYRYELHAGVHIGVYVDLLLFSGTLELGCNLHIWGPEFSGTVEVDLWIISFTICFGAQSGQQKTTIEWSEFTQSFLPSKQQSNTADNSFSCCSIQAAGGVTKEHEKSDGTKQWDVCAEELELVSKSVIPCGKLLFNDAEVAGSNTEIGIKPCGIERIKTRHCISLRRTDNAKIDCEFILTAIEENVPTALWGNSKTGAGETILTCTGLRIRPKPTAYYEIAFAVDCHNSDMGASWKHPKAKTSSKYDSQKAYEYIAKMKEAGRRSKVLATLGMENELVSLGNMTKDPGNYFVEEPILQGIGSVL